MPAPKRHVAQITVGQVSRHLGRWPTKKAAAIAMDRARLFYEGTATTKYAREALRLGAASPEALREEARHLRKARFTSKFEGVAWDRRAKRWRASITMRRRSLFIGFFDSEHAAAIARDRAALAKAPEKRLNFPPGTVKPTPLDALRKEIRAGQKATMSSRYLGVSKDPSLTNRPWMAFVTVGSRGIALGRFATEKEAAVAYDRAVLWYEPERTTLNFPRAKHQAASGEIIRNELVRRRKTETVSRFIGVSWNGFSFTANVSVGKRSIHLGSFDSEEEAAQARDKEALRLQGSRARLNFDPETGEELVGRVVPKRKREGVR